jgi:hypothetical protein
MNAGMDAVATTSTSSGIHRPTSKAFAPFELLHTLQSLSLMKNGKSIFRI